jgi:hypothetical protein
MDGSGVFFLGEGYFFAVIVGNCWSVGVLGCA